MEKNETNEKQGIEAKFKVKKISVKCTDRKKFNKIEILRFVFENVRIRIVEGKEIEDPFTQIVYAVKKGKSIVWLNYAEADFVSSALLDLSFRD